MSEKPSYTSPLFDANSHHFSLRIWSTLYRPDRRRQSRGPGAAAPMPQKKIWGRGKAVNIESNTDQNTLNIFGASGASSGAAAPKPS